MSNLTSTKPWDFSHALELLNTDLSGPAQQRQPAGQPPASPPKSNGSDDLHDSGVEEAIDKKDFAKPSGGLGDFAKIWQYMGVPLDDVRHPKEPDDNDAGRMVSIQDYTSDGAMYAGPTTRKSRGVTWKDQESADETAGSATDHSISPDTPSLKLTKTQRKKQNRKDRKAQEAALAARRGAMSENETDDPRRTTPARKASAHSGTSTPTRQQGSTALPGFVRSGSANVPLDVSKGLFPASVAPPKKKENKFKLSKSGDDSPSTPRPKYLDASKRQLSQPATTTPVKNAQAAALYETYNQDKKQAPLATPNFKTQQYGAPATAQPQRKKDFSEYMSPEVEAARQAVQAVKTVAPAASTPSKRPSTIEPRVIRSGRTSTGHCSCDCLTSTPKSVHISFHQCLW